MSPDPVPAAEYVCAIGGVDDGTLRVCCSTHQHILCGHHYARTHFVETIPEHHQPACNDERPCRKHHGSEVKECSWCGSLPALTDGGDRG